MVMIKCLHTFAFHLFLFHRSHFQLEIEFVSQIFLSCYFIYTYDMIFGRFYGHFGKSCNATLPVFINIQLDYRYFNVISGFL